MPSRHAWAQTHRSKRETRKLQVQLNACEHTITWWVFATAYFTRAITPLHPCLHIFVCHLKCLSLRIWPWCPQTQAVLEVLSWTPSMHWGFKEVKKLFYLILLTHCLPWNGCFAADEFSSSEYFPWKFWHAAGEPRSEGRGDVCLYVCPTGRKRRERVLNEVEACDLAKSRKWKVTQVAELKGYILLSSSLTFALVSNPYNLLWNTLWILLSAALQHCESVAGRAGGRHAGSFILPLLPALQSTPMERPPRKEAPLIWEILQEKPSPGSKHNARLM